MATGWRRIFSLTLESSKLIYYRYNMKNNFTLLFVFFIFNAFAQTATNYGFESWTTVPASFPAPSYENPNNWNTLNGLTSALGVITCFKATAVGDFHSGAKAVKLITKSVAGQIANGLITTGTVNQATSSVGGGVSYTLRPDSIIGWYKCAPMTGDSGFVEIQLLGAGGDKDTIGYVIFRTPSKSVTTYTRFAEEIVYRNTNSVVKSIWILSSSRDNTTHVVNSTIFVDDLQLGSDAWDAATGIDEAKNTSLAVFPNPSAGQVTITGINTLGAFFIVYDAMGIALKQVQLNNETVSINISDLADGTYVYAISDGNNRTIKAGKLVLKK